MARKVLAMTEQDADVPKPGQAIPMTPLTQAVRIATTMTGGVSLAVWMGGVACELSLLGQASNLRRRADPVTLPDNDPRRGYLDLLNLLDVTVDFDVLSGTSAGGINAALLAYSRAAQKDLGSLRKLWLEMGAMETLLRDPTDTEMPSLLQGDAQMYASLRTAIPDLTDAEFRAPTDDRATTLFVTTTLLTGETSRFTDSYGTLLQDVDHRGMFRFESDGTQTGRPATKAGFDPAALALAARSSASFPAAFEPSFVPYAAEVPGKNGVPARPPMGSRSNLTRDHWAADGGLLDNQPIDALLETIFERPAKRLVRRVLLYIVPSGGPAPNPLAVPRGDDVNRPYSMISGLLKDVSAVWNQSISADLRAIREHNDRIGARTDTRLRLAQLAARCAEKKPADPLHAAADRADVRRLLHARGRRHRQQAGGPGHAPADHLAGGRQRQQRQRQRHQCQQRQRQQRRQGRWPEHSQPVGHRARPRRQCRAGLPARDPHRADQALAAADPPAPPSWPGSAGRPTTARRRSPSHCCAAASWSPSGSAPNPTPSCPGSSPARCRRCTTASSRSPAATSPRS